MGADLYSSRGHFRGPDNGWDLLWRFGLSWWNDVVPLLNAERRLSPWKAGRLLALLDEREYEFQESMSECSPEDRLYFQKQAEELRAFLEDAVDLGEAVECSL